jgi:hypothetical protein
MEMLSRGKHSGLMGPFVSYREKLIVVNMIPDFDAIARKECYL